MKRNLLFTFFHILLASRDTELAPPLKLLPSRKTLEWESDASELIWRSWGLTSFLLWLDSMNLWIAYKLGNNFISSNGKGHLSIQFFNIFYGKYFKKIILWLKKWKPRSGLMPSKHVAPKEKVKQCHKTSLWISKGSHIHLSQLLLFFQDWLPLSICWQCFPTDLHRKWSLCPLFQAWCRCVIYHVRHSS